MELRSKFFNLFKQSKSFICGGESCIWFNSGKKNAYIYYRQPTGDEQLSFAHSMLESEKSDLRELSSNKISAETLQRITREKKLIPFAKKIILRWDGYQDEKNKIVNDVAFIEKYFPHHLEVVAIEGYKVDDKYKKKN